MANYWNCEEIRKAIEKSISEKTALKKAWEGVTFPTKKDGKPFATLSKNIEGAKIQAEPYETRPDLFKKLTVYTVETSTSYHYISDDISLWETLVYKEYPKATEKPENVATRDNGFASVYVFDLDDVKAAISERIAILGEQIADLEKQLHDLDKDFAKALKAYKQAMAVIDGIKEKYTTPTSYYAIKETIQSRYEYL